MLNPLFRLLVNSKIPSISKSVYSKNQTFETIRCLSNSPKVDDENQKKILRVAVIGVPNAGKSTLINNLVDRKVCPTSKKVHTTKTAAKAVFIEDNTQIVFVDTPGIITVGEQKKFNLSQEMVVAPRRMAKNVDIIGVIHDVAHTWSRDFLHPLLIHILKKNSHLPSFLVLNKIDIMRSKRKLLNSIRVLCNEKIAGQPIKTLHDIQSKLENVEKGYGGFSDVFIISALGGDGVSNIKNYLVNNAKPGKWQFQENEFSDQTREKLIEETVRAKLLDFLPQEIPYKLITEIEFLNEKDERIAIIVSITAPSERIQKLIAGAGGGKLRQMTDSVRNDLFEMFHKPVSINISIRTETKQKLEDYT